MKRPDPQVICDPKAKGVRLTEQEHKKSCDATYMIKTAQKGGQVRMKPINQDTTQTVNSPYYGSKTELLLEKKRIEEHLDNLAKKEGIDPRELAKAPVQTLTTHLRKKNAASKAASPTQDGADQATAGARAAQSESKNANQKGDKNSVATKTSPNNEQQNNNSQT